MNKNRIRQRTVVGQVMDEIRMLIASGAYSPGDKIPTEKKLAEQFGIGRSSIREALKIFNYLGVLDSKAALGTYVQKRSNISTEALTWSLLLGNDELEELIDLRAAIELWCTIKLVNGCAARHRWAMNVISELDRIIDDMALALTTHDIDSPGLMVEKDYLFHKTIIKSSRNPLFISTYRTLRSFLRIEISKSQQDYENPTQILEEHREIRVAISGGNLLRAIQTHIAHIDNIKYRLRNTSSS